MHTTILEMDIQKCPTVLKKGGILEKWINYKFIQMFTCSVVILIIST